MIRAELLFQEGVRETCAAPLPSLLTVGRGNNTLAGGMMRAVFRQLNGCIEAEIGASFLVLLYRCFGDALC